MTATFHIHHIHSDSSLINHPIIRHHIICAVERRMVITQAVAYYTNFIMAFFFVFRLLFGSTVHIFNVHLNVRLKEGATFPQPVFTKLRNAQQNNVWICYTEFHPNRKLNVEKMDRSSFTPLSNV